MFLFFPPFSSTLGSAKELALLMSGKNQGKVREFRGR